MNWSDLDIRQDMIAALKRLQKLCGLDTKQFYRDLFVDNADKVKNVIDQIKEVSVPSTVRKYLRAIVAVGGDEEFYKDPSLYDEQSWSQLADPKCSDRTNKVRIQDVRRTQGRVFGVDIEFKPELFIADGAYEKVMEYLEPFKHNSRINIAVAICKALYVANAPVQRCAPYIVYADEKSRQSDKVVPDFLTIIETAKKILSRNENGLHRQEIDELRIAKVMSLIIVESIDPTSPTTIGLLRTSDINRTQFKDVEGWSYMDLDNGIWHIRESATKNKRYRALQLSPYFVDYIRKIGTDRDALVMPNCECLSKFFGYSAVELRSSYATYMYRLNIPIQTYSEIAERMGHSYRTSIINYVDLKN